MIGEYAFRLLSVSVFQLFRAAAPEPDHCNSHCVPPARPLPCSDCSQRSTSRHPDKSPPRCRPQTPRAWPPAPSPLSSQLPLNALSKMAGSNAFNPVSALARLLACAALYGFSRVFVRFDCCSKQLGELRRIPFPNQFLFHRHPVQNAQGLVEGWFQFVQLRFAEKQIDFEGLLRTRHARNLAQPAMRLLTDTLGRGEIE